MRETMVVFGGGGIWGVAWMTGVAMALAEYGIDLKQAQGFVGTSAGSVVGTQMASSVAVADLFARQTDPAKQPHEASPPMDGMGRLTALLNKPWETPGARVRAIADLALTSKTISPEQRRADIADRLGVPSEQWPTRELLITAVDTETCELCVFTAKSGVALTDAVAASCAVAGVWPTTPINGRRYMDGGLSRTGDNVHLARGKHSVLIVSPFGAYSGVLSGSGLDNDIAELRQSGSKVALIAADNAALSTVGPLGPLDPSIRAAAAKAGHAQGLREVEKIKAFFA